MIFRVNPFDYSFDCAVRSNEEGFADCTYHGFAVHLLFSLSIKCLKHCGGRVGKQIERKLCLDRKFTCEAALSLLTHRWYNRARQCGKVVAKIAGLCRTTAGIVFRVKIKNNFVS